MENSETVSLVFETKENSADAGVVGAGLVALKEMIDEINAAKKECERILLNARPFSKGSLEIPLEVFALGDAFLAGNFESVSQLMKIIKEFFDIRLQLKGKAPDIVDATTININGSRIKVEGMVVNFIAPSSSVSKNWESMFRRASNEALITGVKINFSKEPIPVANIPREAFESFLNIEEAVRIAPERDYKTTETLYIRQPSFDHALDWRFFWNEGKLSARMEHEEFQKRVAKGLESFRAGDRLEVILARRQEYDLTNEIWVDTPPYRVIEVLTHHDKPEQEELSF